MGQSFSLSSSRSAADAQLSARLAKQQAIVLKALIDDENHENHSLRAALSPLLANRTTTSSSSSSSSWWSPKPSTTITSALSQRNNNTTTTQQQQQQQSDFTILSNEIVVHISLFLNLRDWGRLSTVNKRWYEITNDESAWAQVFMREWGHIVKSPATVMTKLRTASTTWKSFFLNEMTRGVALFNIDPEKGIRWFTEAGFIAAGEDGQPNAHDLARFLGQTRTLQKSCVVRCIISTTSHVQAAKLFVRDLFCHKQDEPRHQHHHHRHHQRHHFHHHDDSNNNNNKKRCDSQVYFEDMDFLQAQREFLAKMGLISAPTNNSLASISSNGLLGQPLAAHSNALSYLMRIFCEHYFGCHYLHSDTTTTFEELMQKSNKGNETNNGNNKSNNNNDDDGEASLLDKSMAKLIRDASAEKHVGTALQMFVDAGVIEDTPRARAILLRTFPGFTKAKIARYLLRDQDPRCNLAAFMSTFDFTNIFIGDAMRIMLSSLQLPGEAGSVDRIIDAFSARYHENNPFAFVANGVAEHGHGHHEGGSQGSSSSSRDTPYVIAFALLMLNTDLHNPHVRNKMTKHTFVQQMRALGMQQHIIIIISDTLSEYMYDYILENPFVFDHEHDR